MTMQVILVSASVTDHGPVVGAGFGLGVVVVAGVVVVVGSVVVVVVGSVVVVVVGSVVVVVVVGSVVVVVVVGSVVVVGAVVIFEGLEVSGSGRVVTSTSARTE